MSNARLNGKTSSEQIENVTRGMAKDTSDLYIPDGMWTHARNATNRTENHGDIGVIGNEPANELCSRAPYTITGSINIYQDYWAIFSTDNTNSEIGLFHESQCEYYKIVNDPCLNFHQDNLIIGRARENYDCSFQLYWGDSRNPDRTMNIGDVRYAPFPEPWTGVPYVCEDQQVGENAECQVCTPIQPLQLDCEKIRLTKLAKTPCIETKLGLAGGNLQNGSYYAVLAYSENSQRATTWSTPSNIQPIFNHRGSGGSLELVFTNLETDNYDEFILVIVSTINNQLEAKQLGVYSTNTNTVSIDYLDPELPTVPIAQIPVLPVSYEMSDGMYQVNDYLLRVGAKTRFDFNYQPLANQIEAEWVMIEQPPDYYRKGGNVTGYMRDEQYPFFIRWIYNTGDKSASYHIPGRAKEVGREINNDGTDILYNTANGFQENSPDNFELAASQAVQGDYETPAIYDVINTAYVTDQNLPLENDPVIPGQIIASGKMGYWESTEIYPDDKPEIWNSSYWEWTNAFQADHDLCGKPIRHHKFPADILNTSPNNNGVSDFSRVRVGGTNCEVPYNTKAIRILGVRFNNIKAPLDNDGNIIPSIVGYEILRGSREGNKTVIAKGLLNNVRSYISEDDERIYFQNYPYNDLDNDPFISGTNTTHNNRFTFHSPDTNFTNPFLNQSELRLYGEVGQNANVKGRFTEVQGHPKHKIITDLAFIVSMFVGLGVAAKSIRGKKVHARTGPEYFNLGIVGNALGTGQGTIYGMSSAQQYLQNQKHNAVYGGMFGNGAYGVWSNAESGLLAWIPEIFANGLSANLADGILKMSTGSSAVAAGKGVRRATRSDETEKSDTDYLGNINKSFSGAITFGYYMTEGADQILDLIRAISPFRQYAYRTVSEGYLHKHTLGNVGFLNYNSRRYIQAAEYLDSHYQNVEGNRYNNLFRSRSVAIHVSGGTESIQQTAGADNTRVRISDMFDTWDARRKPFCRTTHAYYAGIKIRNRNQYGQIDGVKQVFTGCSYNVNDGAPIPNDHDTTEPIVEQSPNIFGGDVYIGRYTEKNTFFYFYDWLFDQPDGYEFDYTLRKMINEPRYFANLNKYETEAFIREALTSIWNLNFSNILDGIPSELHNLDQFDDVSFSSLQDNGQNNMFSNLASKMRFVKNEAAFYLFNSGVRDFYVESEYNVDLRDWGNTDAERHYDPYRFSDLNTLFDTEIIKSGNYYKYDRSLSIAALPSNKTSWGYVQPRYYNPTVAETCFTYFPDRIIYSLPQNQERAKDYWKIFLVNNYEDFGDPITSIKPISKSGSMIMFQTRSPIMFQGVEQLTTDASTKLTLGDGGLFDQALQNLSNADPAYQHGSCQNRLAVVNTPMGLYYMSQSQGKIFQVTGNGLREISAANMRTWFARYLPYRLTQDFPDFELTDNPITGIGCQAAYDNESVILYFSKRDFKVREEFADSMVYIQNNEFQVDGTHRVELGDSRYFHDASWTISYDPKNQMWLSFHDWHPELIISARQNILTTQTVDANGEIWRHNNRTDLFCNFYGQNYPFEIEQLFQTGKTTNTVRSVEYMLEAYKYQGENRDAHHILDQNFNRAVIHNSEQTSGVLKLNLKPKNNAPATLNYPQVNNESIDILYAKEEQKYRFNQFWDVTDDRGEFTYPNVQRPIWTTDFNGYTRSLNSNNLNYQKSPLERKKFRHYTHKVLLSKTISNDVKLIFKLGETNLLYSAR